MQLPEGASQKVPLWQSALDWQSRRAWQKPSWLQNSDWAQAESSLQPQAPVEGSQEKPAAHWMSAVQRLLLPFLQPGAASASSTQANRDVWHANQSRVTAAP